ncbi:YqiA/YcfP family alpha/beta fold hydrolase [Caenimonas aquaedulcis]|uniref:Esterase n=1 Tax=Caenimonas aquaedulcis TaxID=2793270 RepID=A0A931H778_9BURK|nr:YqiA/YcfP family alpha/beta fold hydrolase [Caenimonas aquaedulcis]MBG9389946.1 esterase [Caenimonas aquaedulcis]
MPSTTHLLYLHGFRSSPQSTKARQVGARVREQHPHVQWWCPQLPPSPKLAMEMLEAAIAAWPRERMAVVGSSLGGFYTTCVAQEAGCRAVVLNPAVDPARDLARHIGEHASWHDPKERFFFEPRFVDQLRELDPGPLRHPDRFFAVIAKGDEVLDWREMAQRYAGARVKLLEGSDHALSDFPAHMDEVFDFLDLA